MKLIRLLLALRGFAGNTGWCNKAMQKIRSILYQIEEIPNRWYSVMIVLKHSLQKKS